MKNKRLVYVFLISEGGAAIPSLSIGETIRQYGMAIITLQPDDMNLLTYKTASELGLAMNFLGI